MIVIWTQENTSTDNYLLGLLHGETEGLDWSELDAKELVLRLLSGLLREHTLSIDTLVFLQASHTHSSLHLQTEKCRLALLWLKPSLNLKLVEWIRDKLVHHYLHLFDKLNCLYPYSE